MVRRTIGVLAMSCAMVAVAASVALAQTTTYPPAPGNGPLVLGSGGSNDPTAFTGAQISFAVVASAVLVILGVTALVVVRRRSARLAG